MENSDTKRSTRNDALQSAEGKQAYGDDARLFGAGGQKTQRAFDPGHDDRPDRDPERDESLPSGQHPSRKDR